MTIETKRGSLAFSVNGKMWKAVNVPAYQLWTSSGVTLDRKSRIDITASGLVSTAPGSENYSAAISSAALSANLAKAIENFANDRNMNTSWRGPDGIPFYATNDRGGKNPSGRRSDRISDSLKLSQDAEYGYLLGFFVTPGMLRNTNKTIGDILANRAELGVKIYKIGTGASIEYDKKEDKFFVTTCGDENNQQDIPGNLEGAELYLTVNDCIVTSRDDITGILADPAIRRKQVELHKTLKIPAGIWYLDNEGSFLVGIEKSQRGFFDGHAAACRK
ncbi:MAG: hypothetical protein PHP45_05355 [Elusimicrobiales bacterium]|nr:hypothetical protein [Elusimicrobiales bacterium]